MLQLYHIGERITRVGLPDDLDEEGNPIPRYPGLPPEEVKEIITDEQWEGASKETHRWDAARPVRERVQPGPPAETAAERRERHRRQISIEYPYPVWREIQDKRIAGDPADYNAYLIRKAAVEAT
jgi:hypothetical protein